LAGAAERVAALHRHGFAHRDLKAYNFLIAGAPAHPVLVDLDGLRYRGRVPRARREKDLRRLRRDVLACPRAGDAAWQRLLEQYHRHLAS